MSIDKINGSIYADMVRGGMYYLRANEQIVNDLNVFPIPDGDTGVNMGLTIQGGVREVAGYSSDELCDVASKIEFGMLMNARGNSGVILSQLFSGIADGFKGLSEADEEALACAFEEGVRKAYKAVRTPTEGTILTVAREASAYAYEHRGEGIEAYFANYIEEMHRSLERTPELLPVLREAGVIDSGGAGLVYIIEGMNRVFCGEVPESLADDEHMIEMNSNSSEPDASNFGPDSEMEFGYCTELLLQLQNSKVDAENFDVAQIIDFLETIGDSIVSVKSGTVVKIHVHTMTPGRVLDFCQQFGEFIKLKIENMAIQHSEATIENRYSAKSQKKAEHKEIAIVAVANGDGIRDAFVQFGADAIVEGGQTMNPSSEDFIRAFEGLDADHIIVMPNNGNIILAATQAAKVYTQSDVRILETKTIAEGYAAFTMLDTSSGDVDAVLDELVMAIGEVKTGLVTYAIRDSEFGGKRMNEGDWLGLEGKSILSVESDKVTAACRLLDCIDKTDKCIVIAICGKDTTAEDVASLREYSQKNYPELEWFEIDGGQDVYSFIFAIE